MKKIQKYIEMTASPNDSGRRLDRILRKALPHIPLSGIHRLLRTGRVFVDGKRGEPSVRVMAGSVITVPEDAVSGFKSPLVPVSSGLLSSYILWEGAGLLILNKPAGLAVHGPESLETLVCAYLAPRLPPSLSFRPGPLHRLDKPTSGIIAFSTSLAGAQYFSALMQEGQIQKRYLALVDGNLESPEVWEDPLVRDRVNHKTLISRNHEAGAQKAETLIFPLAVCPSYSLIRAEIRTGRTHQIRAQAAFHRHPLAGDKKYGGSFQSQGFLLHAHTLEFRAGRETALPVLLQAPLPEVFRRRIRAIFGDKAAAINGFDAASHSGRIYHEQGNRA